MDITEIPDRGSWKQDLGPHLAVDARRSLGQIASVVLPYLAVWVAAALIEPSAPVAIALGLAATEPSPTPVIYSRISSGITVLSVRSDRLHRLVIGILVAAFVVLAVLSAIAFQQDDSNSPKSLTPSQAADRLHIPRFCDAYHTAITRPKGREYVFGLFKIGYHRQLAIPEAPPARAVFNEMVSRCSTSAMSL